MKTKLVTQIIVCLALLFGLGGLCGFAMSERRRTARPSLAQRPELRQEWTRRWVERRMAEDFARVAATPQQQSTLRASYDAMIAEFNAIQAESSAKVAAAFKRHGVETWKQLTPAQREQLRQLNDERRQRRATQP
jgi:hypothetical protein